MATAVHFLQPTFIGNKDLNGVHSLHVNNDRPSQWQRRLGSSHVGWIHCSLGRRKYTALGLSNSLSTQHFPEHPLVDQQPTLAT